VEHLRVGSVSGVSPRAASLADRLDWRRRSSPLGSDGAQMVARKTPVLQGQRRAPNRPSEDERALGEREEHEKYGGEREQLQRRAEQHHLSRVFDVASDHTALDLPKQEQVSKMPHVNDQLGRNVAAEDHQVEARIGISPPRPHEPEHRNRQHEHHCEPAAPSAKRVDVTLKERCDLEAALEYDRARDASLVQAGARRREQPVGNVQAAPHDDARPWRAQKEALNHQCSVAAI
jgi:hypothetical protein